MSRGSLNRIAALALVVLAHAEIACTKKPTAREILVAGLTPQLSNGGGFILGRKVDVATAIEIDSTPSAVVRRMRFYRGVFVPPGSYDIGWTALAVGSPDEIRILSTPQDWMTVASDAGWKPTTATIAERACAEIVRYTGAGNSHSYPAIIYHDSTDLSDRIWLIYMGEAWDIKQLAKKPSVNGDEREWHVTLWAIERDRTRKFDCSLRARRLFRSATASLTILDSLAGGLSP